jgi:hypothetical protein
MLDGFQYLEERDANDLITHDGVASKKSAFSTADNAGIYDVIARDLRLLAEAATSLADNTDAQAILAQIKSMYAEMKSNPNWGDAAAKAQAEEALKQAKAAAESAAKAKEYGDKATELAATIAEIEGYINTIDDLKKQAEDTATIATNKANFIVEHEKAAASSASAAASSESAAKTSEMNAKTSETNAAASASAAASSESAAKTSEMNAKTSETNAASSASAAASSESAAKTSETNASNSQTAAAAAASSASTSATKASNHETNAKTALASCQTIQTQVNAGLQSLTSAVKYRGTVASFADLPTSDLSVGDMYNVKAAGGTDSKGTAIKAGDNVVYNGDGWDDQSGTVDLSDYPKNEDVAKAVTSATVANDTVTLIHKDATKTTLTVDNVGHAKEAETDVNGQEIDIAAIKTLITTTVNDAVLATKQAIFPVGSIYISMTDSRNPSEILGFGTWEALPAGHSLVAVGTATETHGDKTKTFTFEAGKTYGEFEHQLTVGELSKHTHRIALTKSGYPNNEPQSILFLPGNTNQGINGTFSDRKVSGTYEDNQSGYYVDSEFIEATGNNQYHNNISPCVSSYIWRRTA